MKFRPCIDLHDGLVKQIVGSTLTDDGKGLSTNFASDKGAAFYAALYRQDGLTGGHIIKLGPGCDEAACEALCAYPGGMQLGGGITADNAEQWLAQGASHVIVTSYVFHDGCLDEARLKELVARVGPDRLVLDLSCRKQGEDYVIVTDRWQKFTEWRISPQTLEYFAQYCTEFLIHAVDVEGKCAGIAEDLVIDLGRWSPIATTYAGGVKNLGDLEKVRDLGQGRLDVTIGSALDIFGGSGISYREAVQFCRAQETP